MIKLRPIALIDNSIGPRYLNTIAQSRSCGIEVAYRAIKHLVRADGSEAVHRAASDRQHLHGSVGRPSSQQPR